MRNTHRSPAFFGASQGKHRHRILMDFHDVIVVFLNHTGQIREIPEKTLAFGPDMVYTSAQRPYFRLIFADSASMNGKIKLYLIPVDIPVEIHQHGFDSTAIHGANHM